MSDFYDDYNNDNANSNEAESVADVFLKADSVTEVLESTENKESDKKEKKKLGKKPFFVKVLAAATIGLAFGCFAAGGFYGVNQLLEKKVPIVANEGDASTSVEELERKINNLQNSISLSGGLSGEAVPAVYSEVTAVVDKVMPSMVSVTNTYEKITSYWGRRYVEENDASGSGIIIGQNDNEYLIATNYHVIEDAKTLSVQFVDSTSAEAYVKGFDSSMDIAVIAVDRNSLEKSTRDSISVAELGDSDNLKMGETAIAIGNALGYGQSVTTGVISALNREIDLEKSVSDLIQTSAAINPGNSGGALLNIRGQVVGINSSKIGSTTVEGMGFAIPINEVKDIIVEFSNREVKNKVAEEKRGYLGISGQSISETGLSSLGFPNGVYIEKVYEGSAAADAGIYEGDIITKADGQSIETIESLQEMLSYYAVGDSVNVVVVRREAGALSETTLTVTLKGRDTIKEE